MLETDMLARVLMALLTAVPLAAQRNDGEPHGDPPFLIEDGRKALFNGKDLAGWHGQDSARRNEWFTTRGVVWERLLGPTRLAGVPVPGDRVLNGLNGRTVNLYLEFLLAKGPIPGCTCKASTRSRSSTVGRRAKR